jgi:hypothetical protein
MELMTKARIRCLVLTIFCSFLVNTKQALAQADWLTLETAHFLIHYQPSAEAMAKRTADVTEYVHDIVTQRLNWVPTKKTHVVLTDASDLANAFAIPFPYNRSVLFLSPPNTDPVISFFDYGDWWIELVIHEYTHLVHLDKGHGTIAGLRDIFGRVPLFFPNALNAPWVTEGLSTHYETDDEAGTGRGQSTYFKMMMRGELISGFKPVYQVNLPISTWPGTHSWYLYGVYFFRFLESQYGEGAGERFIKNYSNNFVPWRIGGTLEQETGKEIAVLWDEFRDWLETNLDLEAGTARDTRLTNHGYYTHGLSSTAKGEVFYVRDDQLAPPALMQLNADGSTQELVELHFGASIDAHETGIAVVQPEICGDDRVNLYYDFYLYRFAEQKLKRVTKCQRLTHVSWHPDGKRLAAVQLDNAGTRLVLMDSKGVIIETIWEAEEGVDIAEIDWSPDGKSIVAARHHRDRNWNVELFDLKQRSWRALTEDKHVQAYPRFSRDGSSVLFASDASGKFQIHQINLQMGQQLRLTNAYLGAFSFTQGNVKNGIYYVGYTSNGHDVFHSDPVDLPVEQSPAGTAANTYSKDLESVAFERRDYSPWSSMSPRWWVPHLGYTSESTELGIITGGNDALGQHFYAIDLAYDFKNNYPVGYAGYGYKEHFLLSASSINDIDVDDDVERIQREDSFSITLLNPLYSLDGSWLPFVGVAVTFESDRFTEDDVTERDDETDRLAGFGFAYISAERRARAISLGDGRAVKLVVETSDIEGSDYSGNIYTLDWQEYARLGSGAHVIGLRYVHGWGDEDPRPFRLGDVQSSSGIVEILQGPVGPFLNKRRYTLRGYENTTEGRRLQLATIDWRFPVEDIETGLMSPPVGLLNVAGNLFVESGATWNDGNEPEEYRSAAGAEIIAAVNLFYLFNLDLRLGYAHGFDDDGEDQVYLKIGGSF